MSTPPSSPAPSSSARSPRLIEHDDASARFAWTIPDVWLRGILAGAEAVLGAWLVVIIPAIATYVATAASPQLGAASWVEASQIGTGLWLAGHGAHLTAGGVTFSLIPLGLSLLAIGLSRLALRRARLTSWGAVAFAWATYLLGAALFAKLAGTPGAYGALGGALVILAISTWWGLRGRYPRLPDAATSRVRAWWQGLTSAKRSWVEVRLAARAGLAGATRALATMLALSAVALLVAVIFAFPLIRAVHGKLGMDAVSSVVAVGAQLLLVPTLIVWALSYLAGPGFSLGTGSLYASGEVISGPLPAVPIFGALPSPESALTDQSIYGYAFVIVGIFLGVFLHRRIKGHLVTTLGAVLVAAGITAAGVAVLALLASGGFGPGRFAADVGPAAGVNAWAVGWKLAAAGGVVVTGLNPATRAGVRAGYAWARELVRGRGRTAQ